MNYPKSLRAWIKRVIVFAAVHDVLQAATATRLIQLLGVAHA